MNDQYFPNHQLPALWAADCAEHVLPIFVDAVTDDQRPNEVDLNAGPTYTLTDQYGNKTNFSATGKEQAPYT